MKYSFLMVDQCSSLRFYLIFFAANSKNHWNCRSMHQIAALDLFSTLKSILEEEKINVELAVDHPWQTLNSSLWCSSQLNSSSSISTEEKAESNKNQTHSHSVCKKKMQQVYSKGEADFSYRIEMVGKWFETGVCLVWLKWIDTQVFSELFLRLSLARSLSPSVCLSL